MQRHYLLETNGIQTKDYERIFPAEEGWTIQLRRPRQGCCPLCGRRSRWKKTSGLKTIQGLGAPGIPVQIILPYRDFYCRNPECSRKTFRINLAWRYQGPRKMVRQVVKVIRRLWVRHGQNNCWIVRFLADEYCLHISEATIRRIATAAATLLPWRYAPKHLGIDEIYPKGINRARGRGRKPTRARVALLDLDTGTVLAIARGKDRKAAEALLAWASIRYDLSRVETVTRDLNLAWDVVLHRHLDRPGQPIVIRVDRFHLVRNLIKVIYRLYTEERTRLREEGRKVASKQIFRNRYRFRKRRSRLEKNDRLHHTVGVRKLEAMLAQNPKLRELYELKELIYQLVDLEPDQIGEFPDLLARICRLARDLGVKGLVDRLARHGSFIQNNLVSQSTHYLPEQCFVPYRAAERVRKSFRTDRSREVYLLARAREVITPLLTKAHTECQASFFSTT